MWMSRIDDLRGIGSDMGVGVNVNWCESILKGWKDRRKVRGVRVGVDGNDRWVMGRRGRESSS